MSTVVESFVIGSSSGRLIDAGSTVALSIMPPYHIPSTALSTTLKLRNSYIWNTFVNISNSLGNRIVVVDPDGIRYNIIFPDGQYNVSNVNDYFTRQSLEVGAPWVDTDGKCNIQINADLSVQKIFFINTAVRPYILDWGQDPTVSNNKTIYTILGFEKDTQTTLPAATSTLYQRYIYAPKQAAFNFVNGVLVKCNLVTRGIRVDGQYRSVLAQVPISEGPGQLMVYEPQQPAVTETGLVGSTIREITVQLTNENGDPVYTPGNPWLVTIDIAYDLIQ